MCCFLFYPEYQNIFWEKLLHWSDSMKLKSHQKKWFLSVCPAETAFVPTDTISAKHTCFIKPTQSSISNIETFTEPSYFTTFHNVEGAPVVEMKIIKYMMKYTSTYIGYIIVLQVIMKVFAPRLCRASCWIFDGEARFKTFSALSQNFFVVICAKCLV